MRALIDNRPRCDKDSPLVTRWLQKYDGQPIEVVGVIPSDEIGWSREFARFYLDALRLLALRMRDDVMPRVVYGGPESRDAGPGESIEDQNLSGVAL